MEDSSRTTQPPLFTFLLWLVTICQPPKIPSWNRVRPSLSLPARIHLTLRTSRWKHAFTRVPRDGYERAVSRLMLEHPQVTRWGSTTMNSAGRAAILTGRIGTESGRDAAGFSATPAPCRRTNVMIFSHQGYTGTTEKVCPYFHLMFKQWRIKVRV